MENNCKNRNIEDTFKMQAGQRNNLECHSKKKKEKKKDRFPWRRNFTAWVFFLSQLIYKYEVQEMFIKVSQLFKSLQQLKLCPETHANPEE